MRLFCIAICNVLFLLYFSHVAHAEKKVALVIGNSNYQKISQLQNPVSDARLMQTTLKSLNFEVILATDLSHKMMKSVVADFTSKLKEYGPDTIGFVFYAGHGVQVDGLNYLIPVDANIQTEKDVAVEAIEANNLLSAIKQANNNLNIIVLDACRDNPYRGLTRSNNRGLAVMNAPAGSIVAYATSPGDVASDGKNNNSPYTQALVKHLVTPGLTIERVLKFVGRDVQKETNGKQRPWQSSDLYEDFYPAGGASNSQENQQVAQIKPLPKPEIQAVQKTPVTPLNANYKNGDVFQECDVCPQMVALKGGKFSLGKEQDKKEAMYERVLGKGAGLPGNLYKLSVSPYAIGRYEVTFEQWDACVADGGCAGYRPDDNGYGRESRPVINVSWDDAQTYVQWLSKKTGQHYRLLSSTEWEYATRGGKPENNYKVEKLYQPIEAHAWLSSNTSSYKTQPVGKKKENAFGIYDLLGNVKEWVEDCHDEEYKDVPLDGSARVTGDCSVRTIRGNSVGTSLFFSDTFFSGTFAPITKATDTRDFGEYWRVGFRVARTIK